MMLMGLVLTVASVLLCLNNATSSIKVDWWESATLYHIYPRSFMDSNGDGIGDINGITSRLDYLKEIGVTAAWLSPVFKSPMVDMGYDISNFTDIDPLFGTMADFDAMLKKALKLGMKIVLDIVPNHSSDECEWFQKSIRREDGYDDFYVWVDGRIDEETGERIPPSNWEARWGGSTWEWNDIRQQYYLHMFHVKQPDFNLTNPKVIERMTEVFGFWLDRGVDAFRIDAVPFFVEKRFENGTYPNFPSGVSIYLYNVPEQNVPVLYKLREYLDKYQTIHGGDTRAMIAESYADTKTLSGYISDGIRNGVQMPMNLNFVRVNGTITAKTVENLANLWMTDIWSKFKVANWGTSNHDNIRVATMKGYNLVDLLTIVYHAMPGTSLTYYGEEIGMTDYDDVCIINPECDFRDPARTPMQWDTSKNAGFSTGDKPWIPVNHNYQFLNVQAQRKTVRSTLEIFKGMTRLKKTSAFKAFKEDGGFAYGALNEQVFHIMRTDKTTEEYHVLANFGNQIEHIDGLTNKTMEYVLLNSYSPHKKREKVDLNKSIYLLPFEAVVLRWVA